MRFRFPGSGGLAPLLVSGALALGGCIGNPNNGPPYDTPQATGPAGDGKVFIRWTLGGQPPSAQSCTGVDHLVLALLYTAGPQVQILPILCPLTRFRYDKLPDGDAVLQLQALDGNGCVVSQGSAGTTVAPTLPSTPSPTVALGPMHPCR